MNVSLAKENIWRMRFFFSFSFLFSSRLDGRSIRGPSWTSKTRRYWPDVNRERIDDVFRIRNYVRVLLYAPAITEGLSIEGKFFSRINYA